MAVNFIEHIIEKDKELSLFLNHLGSEQWDAFWFFITNQFNWIPLFLVLLVLIYFKFGIKKTLFLVLFLIVILAFSDQFTNFIKNMTMRLRPCNTPGFRDLLRSFDYKPRGYSFWSGHACSSLTVIVFVVLLLRKHYKYSYALLLFPLVFGYSRLYLGVHFPIDVMSGYVAGGILGSLFYILFNYLSSKIFKY